MWMFIQNQILGMQWLSVLVGEILTSMGVDLDTRLGSSLQFFIYDVIKIFILLGTLIFVISYIQSYFPPERTKRILGRFSGLTANILSALLGTITPFCSCSSIPLFMGFTRAGLPIGVTFSFLISSPMVDLGSLVILSSIFGFKIAVVYVLVGLVIAVIGGTFLDKLKMERYVASFVTNVPNTCCDNRQVVANQQGNDISNSASMTSTTNDTNNTNNMNISSHSGLNEAVATQEESFAMSFQERVGISWEQVKFTFNKVWLYVLIGVGIGAGIHNYIPQEWVVAILGEDNPFGVLIATVVGIPMYADIFGTIPIAEALLAQGAQLGVVLSLMMAVTTLSLPSLVLLRRVVHMPLLLAFVAICTVGIVIVGYLFNAMMPWLMS